MSKNDVYTTLFIYMFFNAMLCYCVSIMQIHWIFIFVRTPKTP